MYALYARQSVEKEDSISVESQLEYCRMEARGVSFREYVDKGYSGKNTSRPAFHRMMGDIKKGEIQKVVVYKLDRISRSILDFSSMMEAFARCGVEFVSSTEKFDTSTPIGRAMLNICVVFAQLERETIQKRVCDAYRSRCRKGLYMGGRVPYGFTKEPFFVDNVKTSRYRADEEQARHIEAIYELYARPGTSLQDVVKELGNKGIFRVPGGAWNTARISEIIRNPVYVKANAEVYRFFEEQGAVLIDPIDKYTGENGCYLYKGDAARKLSNAAGQLVVLAPHKGIVAPELWLFCRKKALLQKSGGGETRKKSSWLVGKVRCALCGSRLLARTSPQGKRYLLCSGKARGNGCPGPGTLYADDMETLAAQELIEKLSSFRRPRLKENGAVDEGVLLRRCAEEIERKIEELLKQVPKANDVMMGYLNAQVEKLEQEKERLLASLKAQDDEGRQSAPLCTREEFTALPPEGKALAAGLLLDVIEVGNGVVCCRWRL